MAIDALIFDIGDVLAEIIKEPVRTHLSKNSVVERDFFDEDFLDMQRGKISSDLFFTKKCQRFSLVKPDVIKAFIAMIDAKTAAHILPKIKKPYLFFSNINEIHFTAFSQTLSLSTFAQHHSLLSYQVGYLKPEREFFCLLKKTVARHFTSALYIDDKVENLKRAERIGLRVAHCPGVHMLADVLSAAKII